MYPKQKVLFQSLPSRAIKKGIRPIHAKNHSLSTKNDNFYLWSSKINDSTSREKNINDYIEHH